MQATKVLLQAGLDVGAMISGSLSTSVPADGILMGFCLLSSSFLSLL